VYVFRHGSGIVCVCVAQETARYLNAELPPFGEARHSQPYKEPQKEGSYICKDPEP